MNPWKRKKKYMSQAFFDGSSDNRCPTPHSQAPVLITIYISALLRVLGIFYVNPILWSMLSNYFVHLKYFRRYLMVKIKYRIQEKFSFINRSDAMLPNSNFVATLISFGRCDGYGLRRRVATCYGAALWHSLLWKHQLNNWGSSIRYLYRSL